jgi:predicted secreted protein
MPGRAFAGCFNCHGANGCPRATGNSIRCTANSCKEALTQRNKEARLAAAAAAPAVATQPVLADEMPDDMQVHELAEILGERGCKVHELDSTRRRSGPGKYSRQEFCVRGTFINEEISEDEDEDYELVPEANTYWVDQDDLRKVLGKPALKRALKARHEKVLGGI